MVKKRLFNASTKRMKRFLAGTLSFAMAGSLISVGTVPVTGEVKAAALSIQEDFESSELAGVNMGSPSCEVTEEAHEGNGALHVTGREQDWYSYSYNVSEFAGKSVNFDAFMKVGKDDLTVAAVVKSTVEDEDSYGWAASTSTQSGEWVELKGTYTMPEGANTLYFITQDNETGTTDDFYLDDVSIKETKILNEDFNDYTSKDDVKGSVFGSPVLELSDAGSDGSKALQVSGREANYYGYAYNVAQFAGNTINLTAKMAAYEAEDDAENVLSATIKTTKSDVDDDYQSVATATATGKDFVTLTGTYEIPADCDSYDIYFEAPEGVSYLLDDVSITIEGDYTGEPEKPAYVDTSSYESLKELYSPYFKIGVASEAISHWDNALSEIGNPAKEALITQEFNSLTFGNELKPDYNMGYTSEDKTEEDLPFVIDKAAKEMLDWAKDNGVPVRGHTLVWHSQCPDAIFCKNYTPVYKDDAGKILDPECYVSADVMRKRLESYINHVMEYMYANGYGTTIYAWDVVNEAVEPGTNSDDLRNSYWYQTMGNDFMYYAFKYAREAEQKYSTEYASLYDVDVNDEAALKAIQPKLFYNDYNEFQPAKRDAIIKNLTQKINGHSIVEDGYIDGVGMQAHIQDTTDIDTFIEALNAYSDAVGEVHITELDVAQTATGVNAEYYQGAFYNKFFKALVAAKENGANLSCVTIWGLTDDNSWKKESSPLLFRSDLSKKLAFDGMVYAITGEEMPEPAYVAPDFTDINADFETEGETDGFTTRGDGTLTVQDDITCCGNGALLDSNRTGTWNGASFDVSRFVGQTIAVSAWVRSKAAEVKLSADIDNLWPNIATVDTSSGKWVHLTGTYKVPNLTALKLYFEASDLSDIYIDHVKVKLVGLDEGFEDAENIASGRGVGHVPVVAVTDTQSHNEEGHSFYVRREAQDANMKFDVSKYIGQTIDVKAYVKTDDTKISLGMDGDNPEQIAQVDTVPGEWTEVSGVLAISNSLTSASMYIETDGNADFYVDDISVRIADFEDDVEGETLNFTTRWGGAGSIAKVEDGEGNHAAVLTEREESYYGTVFDVSAFLGMEVEISIDVKTDDSTISLTGDLGDTYPNYASVSSDKGNYKTVRAIVNLPKDVTSLKIYVETDGKSDLYVDNLKIRRVTVDEETVVPNPDKTAEPSASPSAKPSAKPSAAPSAKPSTKPSVKPTASKVYNKTIDCTKVSTPKVSAAGLKKFLSSGKSVVVKLIGKSKKYIATWTFSTSKYSKSVKLKDVKIGVTVTSGKSVGYSKGMYLSMKQQGKLPMEASLKIKADSRFKAGSKLYLYRIDTKTKKLYSMPNSSYKVSKDGYITLNIISGAKYVLLPSVAKKAVSVLSQVKTVKSTTIKKGKSKSLAAKLPDTLLKVSSMKYFKSASHKAVYGATVTYTTNKKSVATVTSSGKVVAKKKGKAVITTTVKLSNGSKRTYKTTVTVK